MSAALVAAAAQNPELVKSATEMVKTAQSNAMKVLKVIGIAVGAGLATFVIVKLVKKTADKVSKDNKAAVDAEGTNPSNAKLSPSQHNAIADKLADDFDLNAWKSKWYNESDIKAQLSKIPTKDDWGCIVTAFGSRKDNTDGKYHTLVEYLLQDDDTDRAEYQKILDKIGVTALL